MRRQMVGFLIAALALASAPAVSVRAVAAPGQAEPVRVLLVDRPEVRAQYAVRAEFPGRGITADVPASALAGLRKAGLLVETVAPRYVDGRPKPGPVVPSDQVPYGIELIYGASNFIPSGGGGVQVAVLDTGIYRDHPDLSRRVADCADFSQMKNSFVNGVCSDGHGHGTHVSGTVAADGGPNGTGIYGVAPETQIFSYKVLSDRGSGYADDIARAIRYAADQGAEIISMSLGGPASSLELDAIRYAAGKGVLIVAAAGNSGPNLDTIDYPGAYAEVVAVAAIDANRRVADFSSRGIPVYGTNASIDDREVEVAGPGVQTESTANTGGYAVYSGTSMATPHIAGLAAKMWQGTAAKTRSWLATQAQQHDITSGLHTAAGYDPASGYGLPTVQ